MYRVIATNAALAIAALPALALAQSAPAEDAVVITASRTEQPLRDAIPHTTILTRKDISDSQAVDLPSLLQREAGDRKSTRLNSSHGYISYAVFCLKKKKYS